MELQHINVKLFLEEDASIDFEKVVECFHEWTASQSMDELLIDVADYLHVPSGPGIVLVGHEADYALDNAQGRWGLLYNRKSAVDGSNSDRFQQAFHAAANACGKLEQPLSLKFKRNEFQLTVNDRAFAPNTSETFEACQDEIKQFVQQTLGLQDAEIQPETEPRRRFGVHVKSNASFELPVNAS